MASKHLRDKLELARWDLLNEIAINLSLAREIRSGIWFGAELRTEEALLKEARGHLRMARRAKRRYMAIDHACDMARAGKTDRQIWRYFATTSEMGYHDASSITRYASSARDRLKNAYAYELERAENLRLRQGHIVPIREPRYVTRCIRAERITSHAPRRDWEREHAFAEEETHRLLNR